MDVIAYTHGESFISGTTGTERRGDDGREEKITVNTHSLCDVCVMLVVNRARVRVCTTLITQSFVRPLRGKRWCGGGRETGVVCTTSFTGFPSSSLSNLDI